MAKIAILGFGVVGSGVYDVINKNSGTVRGKAGDEIEIKYILARKEYAGTPFEKRVVHDFAVIEMDPEVSVVSESIGGVGAAYEYTVRALKAGKSVVTSNKELVATHGYELMQLARENGVNYMFEASVGGGIPVIRPMFTCLAGNEIDEISGILNGTTNYILTKMINESVSFADALKEAQELGYAESDPSADVDGIDAQRKLSILTTVAYGEHVYPEAVYAEGITKITLEDVALAEQLGYVIKLIGHTCREDGSIYAYVAPHMVPKTNMLAGVQDVFNAVMVKGNMVDEVLFYGKGAGKLPTASAMVADIIDCVKHRGMHLSRKWEDGRDGQIASMETYSSSFFVAIRGTEADARATLPVRKAVCKGGVTAVITEKMQVKTLKEKIRGLAADSRIVSEYFVL